MVGWAVSEQKQKLVKIKRTVNTPRMIHTAMLHFQGIPYKTEKKV